MSKTKEFYHDEICRGLRKDHIDDEYFYEQQPLTDEELDAMYDAQAEEQAFLDLTYSQGILPA
jgi:hypothetical protein